MTARLKALPTVEELAERCWARGWRLRQHNGTLRINDATTGALIARDLTDPNGYGLSMAAVDKLIANPPPLPPPPPRPETTEPSDITTKGSVGSGGLVAATGVRGYGGRWG